MMVWLADYGLFLLKLLTVSVVVLLVIGLVARMKQLSSAETSGHLNIRALHERFAEQTEALQSHLLSGKAWKQWRKAQQQALKAKDKAGPSPRVFVLDFKGDLAASAVRSLREEVSAVLAVADPTRDEVLLRLDSPGGMVPGYGLAASQLARVREAQLPLTICVDQVAASGGYLMACLATHLVAAPFAVLGSIGVVAQIPNVHRLLKRHAVDVELLTAGTYKRTLTVLGENTPAGRQKFQEDLEDTHTLFKNHVAQWRPQLSLDVVGNGDHWYSQQAVDLKLVDALATSDEVIRCKAQSAEVYELRWTLPQPLARRLGLSLLTAVDTWLMRWWQRGTLPGPR